MTYHLLVEGEVFSAYRGGAVARTIANIMRFDAPSVVVCGDWDDTWGYGRDRILVIPGLRAYVRIKGRRFLPPWITGPLLRRILQPLLLRIARDDIVWCHAQPHFSAALERTLHLKGARLIHHCESLVTCYTNQTLGVVNRFKTSVAGYVNRSAFQRFAPDAYIFCSEALRQEALELFPWWKNTYTIHNGADEALFYPLPTGTVKENAIFSILYVGRLNPEKGIHVLMGAMKLLQERNVHAVCRVVGSSYAGGSRPTPYVRWLHKHHPSNVQFEGFYSGKDIAKTYRAADVFCCPSIYQEPFGNVNIEAMACGIPVVATRVGGIPEIAAEGGVVLVEPDSAVALADALQKLIEDKDLREKVAAEGQSSFQKRFTWPAIFEKYQEVVKSLNHTDTETKGGIPAL
jgi:spore coat protein SA